jgi:DNA-binding MarR family transcriptional regulator
MARDTTSSPFTNSAPEPAFGPPLIGALLRMPWEAVQRRMLERLHERGFDDLDAAHLNVFQYPGPQGARPSELAARLRVSKQALNYLLGEMERLGYLMRRDDPEDRRAKRVEITARGREVVRSIRRTVRAVEAEWERELGPERFALLRALLLDLNETAAVREASAAPPERSLS